MPDYDDIIFGLGRLARNITPEARDGLIRASLPAIFDRDIGITKSAEIYRSAGFRFGNEHFREIFNEEIFSYQANTQIQSYPREEQLTHDILGTTKYDITGNYRFVAEVTVLDRETNLADIRYFTVDMDTLDTIAETEDNALTFYIQNYGALPEKPISIRLISGQKNKSLR